MGNAANCRLFLVSRDFFGDVFFLFVMLTTLPWCLRPEIRNKISIGPEIYFKNWVTKGILCKSEINLQPSWMFDQFPLEFQLVSQMQPSLQYIFKDMDVNIYNKHENGTVEISIKVLVLFLLTGKLTWSSATLSSSITSLALSCGLLSAEI